MTEREGEGEGEKGGRGREGREGEGRGREGESLPSAGSLPRYLQQPGLAQVQVRGQGLRPGLPGERRGRECWSLEPCVLPASCLSRERDQKQGQDSNPESPAAGSPAVPQGFVGSPLPVPAVVTLPLCVRTFPCWGAGLWGP